MRHLRNLLTRYLAAFVFFFLSVSTVFSQTPPADPVEDELEIPIPKPFSSVKTILLLTSYPVADIVTSNFFDAFRKSIREQNLPVDCHVVELNATHKGNEDRVNSTFDRLERALNEGLYSIVVTLNHEAADVIMRNYDRFPRSVPVLFAGLGRMPVDLKRLYPNSTGIGIPDDTAGTVELGLKLFPEAQNLLLVTDETTISEETRNDILSRCKLHFPQLDYSWVNSLMTKRDIQRILGGFSDESLVLFFPTHDYANGHNETMTAFMRNIGFDERFPCLALDDTLFGNGVVGGSVIETDKLGREAARTVAQILNADSAQRVPVKEITPRRIVDYTKFKTYENFSGRIPLGTTVINKPETMWTRHWQTFLTIFAVIIIISVLQVFYFSWTRRRLRTSRNMLYSLPGRVMVLNRSESILFLSWIKEGQKEKAPKKLEQLIGIDYPKLSQTVHEVFQSGKQITIEYNYEDVHRAISFATLEHDIFGQDAVICFSLDNTELQFARRQAEKYSAQLKKNTRMWDILINFLPIHIFAKDIDDDFRYVFNNRTRCMFYGVGENKLNDKTDFDFLPRELAEQIRQRDLDFVANPEAGQQETNVDVKSWDGRNQHLRCLQRIFTDEDGTRLLLGTSVNITELEEARLQLQQLNGKLQELLQQHSILLDNMPSFVMTKDIDDDFRIITCNEACLKFLNLPLASVAGKTEFEVLSNREDAEAVHAEDIHAVEVLEHRPEYHSTGRLHDHKGRIRIGKFYRKLIKTSDNRRILFSLFHDVTDIENAKREAEESADRFLLTLRSIGDGVITTDSQGVVTLINPNAEKMLGCKQNGVLGSPHTDFFHIVHEQTGKPVPSPLTDALRSGEVAEGEDQTDLVSASGQRYHIASNAAPIRSRSGEITGAILVFRDVTEERNKREELRQTMESLENASDMARLASFRYELKSRRRSGSSLIHTLWPDDDNGEPMRFEDWVHPEDVSLFGHEIDLLVQSGKQDETVTYSFRVGQTSSLRYYRAMVTLDMSNPNEPALTGILQDITELTLNMLKLKDTQALWDAAINAIPIMFTVKDISHDFRYLLCNNAFANMFNLSPREIVGKTDHELFQNEDTLNFADRMNNPALAVDATEDFEEDLPDGNGHLHYIKTVTRVLQDASGRKLLLAASSDVTDMQKLIRNQKLINDLLEDIIGEDDFDQCIQRTLENVCKLLGASRGCLIQHSEDGTMAHCVSEFVEPEHSHAEFKMLGRTLSRVRGIMENTDDQRTFICSDTKDVNWSFIKDDWKAAAKAIELRAIFLSNLICNGEIWGTVGFNFEGVDHTFTENDSALLHATAHMIELVLARKQAKALIMDALARAQAADKAKSFFIASVSHEIRTPLNSVIGFAELLREGGVSKAQQKEYLDAISSSANALLMLINDVLDLSKLEANQMQIITAFTDFNTLCREVLLIFTFRAQENGNKLVSDVPDDLPELDVDNIRIRQILINLLGNAVKFTKKGAITLRVSFTPDSPETGTLRCAVSDTGIGISEEDQKKLMEPFVQLSKLRGTNAVNNGTGLGLSISKRLATCMNGELTCSSTIGEGSTFAVTLNAVHYRKKAAVEKPQHVKPVADTIARDVKEIRILVVDDVPMNLRVAKALFKKIGFPNVFIAGSGKEALELLEKQPIDLILSDMWMPEMNGAQLSAAVKKDPRFSHIPVVAQTADVETSGNFDMSYFDAILLKPITGEKLSNMIKRIVEDGLGREGNDGDGPINLG
jgi:PAS domain S-box-containing protein